MIAISRTGLIVLTIVSGISLCACNRPQVRAQYNDQAVMTETAAMDIAPPPALRSVEGGQGGSAIPVSLPQLAYNYSYGFTAEAEGADKLLKGDQARCGAAGAVNCQMIAFSSETYDSSGAGTKTLTLRVTPDWLKTYQADMDKGLKAAHARISSQSVSSEDLSLQIVDTQSRLKNKEALRDRLQQIIRSGPGKVGDLVEAETQLSKVQEDIDAAKSTLLLMQKRVATIVLTLQYLSEPKAVSGGTFEPVTEALKNLVGTFMQSLGFLISLIASLLPFVLVLGPLGWFVVKRFKLKWPWRRKTAAEPEHRD